MPSAAHTAINITTDDNLPPKASFSYTKSNLLVNVNATTSSDTDGTIASYGWTFGDGGTASTASASHTYAAAGTYTIILTVTDNDSSQTSTSQSVTVTAAATFTLGTTKPIGTSTSANGNVGTGVIRALPTGSAGTRNGDQTVAAGATLQGYTINGDVTIASNGQLLDCVINGRVKLTGNGALIENNEIRGNGTNYDTTTNGYYAFITCSVLSGTRNTVQYNRIHSTVSMRSLNGVAFHTCDIYRNEIYDVVDGIGHNGAVGSTNSPDGNMSVKGNHIHDLISYKPDYNRDRTHNDGTQSQGGTCLIEGNNYEMTWSSLSTDPNETPYVQLSAFMGNHTQATQQPTIKNNWFSGAQVLLNFLDTNTYSNGATYVGMTIVVTGNRFDLSQTGGGSSGACAIAQEAQSSVNLTWSGNTNQSGATIAGPVYF